MIRIPEFVEEYYGAYKSKDYEDCSELKEHFYKTFNRLGPSLQESLKTFLEKYLLKNKINDKKDLGGVFKDLNLKLN